MQAVQLSGIQTQTCRQRVWEWCALWHSGAPVSEPGKALIFLSWVLLLVLCTKDSQTGCDLSAKSHPVVLQSGQALALALLSGMLVLIFKAGRCS